MTAAIDLLVNILSSNWNSSNTDSNTPEIGKITDYKRLDGNLNKDWVLIGRGTKQLRPAGTGIGNRNFVVTVDIDIRSFGRGQENHWNKVIGEVDRILNSNIILPGADFDELLSDGQRIDQSDKSRDIFREVITCTLSKYAEVRPS